MYNEPHLSRHNIYAQKSPTQQPCRCHYALLCVMTRCNRAAFIQYKRKGLRNKIESSACDLSTTRKEQFSKIFGGTPYKIVQSRKNLRPETAAIFASPASPHLRQLESRDI
jgi:hypothetical protein